jgi:hypothetical protein
MRILKPGRLQTGWAKEQECTGNGNGNGGCGALLLVEQGDLFSTEASHQGEVDHFVTFRCEACGVLTDIDGVPSYVQDSLPTRQAWMEVHLRTVVPDTRD